MPNDDGDCLTARANCGTSMPKVCKKAYMDCLINTPVPPPKLFSQRMGLKREYGAHFVMDKQNFTTTGEEDEC